MSTASLALPQTRRSYRWGTQIAVSFLAILVLVVVFEPLLPLDPHSINLAHPRRPKLGTSAGN